MKDSLEYVSMNILVNYVYDRFFFIKVYYLIEYIWLYYINFI